MKLLMIFVDAAHATDVRGLLDRDPRGYSEFPSVMGKGTTGRKRGTRTFPGTSTLFVAARNAGDCRALGEELAALRQRRAADEGLKAYCLDTQEII